MAFDIALQYERDHEIRPSNCHGFFFNEPRAMDIVWLKMMRVASRALRMTNTPMKKG